MRNLAVKNLALGLALGTLALGCGSSAPNASPPPKAAAAAAAAAAPVAKAPEAVAAPAPPVEAKDAYVYSPIGKRDPFRNPLDDMVTSRAIESHCPLCRWAVDQLKLVAVVTGTANPLAMVEDPDGIGHMVRQGTQVGKNSGKVTAIRRDQVVIAETTHDPFGKLVESRIVLRIAQSQNEIANPVSLLNE
jgi:type IV pilus assembly protein PilP